MNNLQLVNDALSLIGVLPEGMNATAEQGDLALRVAGQLSDEWADDGIIVNWPPSTSLQDDCTLAGAELTAMTHVLAVRLCPHFGRDPSGTLAGLAAGAFGKLQRIQLVRSIEPVDTALPMSEAVTQVWDITSG